MLTTGFSMVSKAVGAHGLRETVNQAPVGIRTQVPQEDTLECVQDAATMVHAGPGFPNSSCLKPTFRWPLRVMCLASWGPGGKEKDIRSLLS